MKVSKTDREWLEGMVKDVAYVEDIIKWVEGLR